MGPEAVLREKQGKIIEKWTEEAFSVYPPESARFFSDTKDPFANPVGTAIRRGITLLFEEAVKDPMDLNKANAALEPIIRLRAVQEMSPSKAVSFIFAIKKLVRKEFIGLPQDKSLAICLSALDANADGMMLLAMDMYMRCRQTVYALRINQAKETVRKLLIKKGLMIEIPDAGADMHTDINTDLQALISKRCTGIL